MHFIMHTLFKINCRILHVFLQAVISLHRRFQLEMPVGKKEII